MRQQPNVKTESHLAEKSRIFLAYMKTILYICGIKTKNATIYAICESSSPIEHLALPI